MSRDEMKHEDMLEQARRRKYRIQELLMNGWSDKEIASDLGIPIRTVKAHMGRMFREHGIKDGIKRVKLAVILYNIERGKETK